MGKRNIAAALSRLTSEADRIEEIKARSARPEGCGPEIVDVAPARGPVQSFQPREAVMTEAGNVRVTRSGHNGHNALRRADAFDVMMVKGQGRCKADAGPMFTAGQLSAARDYAALYERCAAAGVKCSSIEALGSGGQGSFIDAVIRDSQRLAALDRAVGNDVVLSPRGAQAHSDRGRKVVRASDLVACTCVRDMTIAQMLQCFGWPVSTVSRNKARAALCAALDRMQGFRD
jgi:regulator of RNase E activity RraA